MNELIRAALVIARRDYVASVWSKTFLFFLIGPLLPMVAGGLIGQAMAPGATAPPPRAAVTVIADSAAGEALQAARARLVSRVGEDMLPDLRIVAPSGAAAAQARALLVGKEDAAVAVPDGPDAIALYGDAGAIARSRDGLGLVWDAMRAAESLRARGGATPVPARFETHAVAAPKRPDASGRRDTAKYAQLALLMLTMMLAGMLLSNLIEEKSSKVIEVLAAAVPVDAIFLGKLMAMLGMSLTAISIWGPVALAGVLARGVPLASIPAPAVGWAAFLPLGVAYFVACYLLLGSLFLGIGAQASTVREVQTLSLPVTMGQIGVFAFGVTVLGAPDSGVARAAMLFPWSSPFAMIGRAALEPALWPHLLAILWQAAWIALIIRVASQRFRRSVLKSGAPRGRRWLNRRARALM